MSDVYELYRRGTALLEARDYHAATVALSSARALAPEPTSIREALGRAYFHARQHAEAAAEFEAVVQRAPTNDYALFCLGRSLQQLGRHAQARRPLALAARRRPPPPRPRAPRSPPPPACAPTAPTTASTATEPAPRREPVANLRLTPH